MREIIKVIPEIREIQLEDSVMRVFGSPEPLDLTLYSFSTQTNDLFVIWALKIDWNGKFLLLSSTEEDLTAFLDMLATGFNVTAVFDSVDVLVVPAED